jgi:TolA-binding protein
MNLSQLVAICLGAVTCGSQGWAAETPAGGASARAAGAPAVQKVEAGAVQSGLASLWGKLRAVSPGFNATAGAKRNDRAAVQVAGVRGDEATQTSLQPYWKDDDESDPAFRAELTEYRAAQQLADDGKFAPASTAFDSFVQKHPGSRLRANAQFGAALAALGAGQNDKGRTLLQQFVTSNPKHPLKADAERLLKN